MIPRPGWNAYVYEGPSDWARGAKRLTIFNRWTNGGGQQLVGWDGFGDWITEEVEAGAMLKEGFPLPAEVFDHLGEILRPGPSAAEVKRLEEALAYEREQVRRLTDELVKLANDRRPGPVPPPGNSLLVGETFREFIESEARQPEGA